MTPRPAQCHPDRQHVARGLCRSCYYIDSRKRKTTERLRRQRRPCALCGRPFSFTKKTADLYCGRTCAVVVATLLQGVRDGAPRHQEEFFATRDKALFLSMLAAYVERGCRRVDRKAPIRTTNGPYVAAWHRGGGLYLIRARLPDEFREEKAA